MTSPRRSSGSWRERQEKDPYVRKARKEGWRSRAVFKLEEIDRREKLLRPGMICVDLGAAPGGWSQYVTERLQGRARILAVDLLAMDALPAVEFLQGDFTEESVAAELLERLGEDRADLVLSDMAPNISGTKAVDQPRSVYLAELALDLARQVLKPGGDFVCKLFQGEGTDAFIAEVRRSFGKVRAIKPRASRSGSSEIYLVARNYRL
ncbi:MAG: 23S rRNA methyltransferase [Gammaproteobacteria bacterium]|nr:23S rRNA methyltransferase [Gammaproteobacteria bacterium]MDH4254740.1 23S rRNA methyltransferase [Gammaproteobacteria bacterium]MDH5308746.1 23S rRNA methyltransferase [Gammaproteobacteria bacterium]